MACLKTHELQTERENRRVDEGGREAGREGGGSVQWEKVSLCAVLRRSPSHIRANESIPPPVMAAPARGLRKEQGGEKSGRRGWIHQEEGDERK